MVRYRAHTKPGMGETDNDVIATFGGIEWHTLEIHGRGILDPRCATILAGPFKPEQVVAAMECGKLLEASLELFGEDSEAQEPGTDAYTWRYLAQDALAAYNAAGR